MIPKNMLALSLTGLLTLTAAHAKPDDSLADAELITDSYTFEELSALDQDFFHINRLESDSSSSCSLVGKSEAEKQSIFKRAVNRVLNVNNFENEITLPGQDFILHDQAGKITSRAAQKGDFIEIKLPMDPTLRTYWVKIEEVNSSKNEFKIIVRPTRNPHLKFKSGVTDHFFTSAATNTFSVSYSSSKLIARIHGLNEEANTTEARSWADAAANATIATMAWGVYSNGKAKMGLQSYTWKSLTTSLADCN
jgi:hypothetical protein